MNAFTPAAFSGARAHAATAPAPLARRPRAWLGLALALASPAFLAAQSPSAPRSAEPAWNNRPLSLRESIDLALAQNGDIVRARQELEAAHGVSLQIRAAALPTVKASGDYVDYRSRSVDNGAAVAPLPSASQVWMANIRVIQPVYAGGRIQSSVKMAALTREEALARFQAATAEKLVEVRAAYYDVLVGAARIATERAGLQLRERQAQELKSRAGTGLSDRFETLRADAELARGRQRLLHAESQARLDQVRLLHVLGFSLGSAAGAAPSLTLSDALPAAPAETPDVQSAIERALQRRPELDAQAKALRIETERLSVAHSGYKPSVNLLGGYGGYNDPLDRRVTGWFAGAQVDWNLFDGLQTQGKIREARARLAAAETRFGELKRTIVLEVRTAHVALTEAREMLAVAHQLHDVAAEGLRLAQASRRNGLGSPIDLAAAEHAAAEAHFSVQQAQRDVGIAAARLDRATGLDIATNVATGSSR